MKKEFLVLFLAFLVLELIGFYLGARLVGSRIVQPETSAGAGISFFIGILVATGIVILAIKVWPVLLKILALTAIFLGSEVFFEIIFLGIPNSFIPAIILALLIVYLRIVFPKNIWTQNLALTTSILGIGPLLGSSLGMAPAWVLLGLLAIYDYISVFKTKHMVYLAENVIKQRVALVMAMPVKKRILHLGGGDVIMPMIVSVAIYNSLGIVPALLSLFGGALGFLVVLETINKVRKPLPALPPITLGMVLGYLLGTVI